jgi:hypothetical protein
VLEGVGVVERKAKNKYTWFGLSRLHRTLAALKANVMAGATGAAPVEEVVITALLIHMFLNFVHWGSRRNCSCDIPEFVGISLVDFFKAHLAYTVQVPRARHTNSARASLGGGKGSRPILIRNFIVSIHHVIFFIFTDFTCSKGRLICSPEIDYSIEMLTILGKGEGEITTVRRERSLGILAQRFLTMFLEGPVCIPHGFCPHLYNYYNIINYARIKYRYLCLH